MLKTSASGVLTSLRGSTDGKEYASPLRSLPAGGQAALLGGLFDHPASDSGSVWNPVPWWLCEAEKSCSTACQRRCRSSVGRLRPTR